MFSLKQILTFLAILLGLGVVVFLCLSLNFALRARTQFLQAEQFEREQQFELAIHFYEQTIRNFSLFSPYHSKAKKRLLALAQQMEQEGKLPLAIQAYDALIASLSAIETGYLGNRPLVTELQDKALALREQLSTPTLAVAE